MQLTESEMQTVEMETDMMETDEIKTDEIETAIVKDETVVYTLEKGEASNGTVVFSREGPLVNGDPLRLFGGCSWRASEIVKSGLATSVSELGDIAKVSQEIKFSREDRIELGRMLHGALCSHNWEHAEFLILLADPHTLNDALCISLDSIWFLTTQEELDRVIGIAKMIIANGAYDFTRATFRNSFLASCVFACRSQTMNLTDTVPVMAQRLRERLQECNEDAAVKAAAAVKVQKFTEWALKCIGFHSRSRGNRDGVNHNSSVQIQQQLSTFKAFLDLAGNNLTGKDFSGAFDAACFPLTLFTSLSDPDWASCVSATAIQGLLSMLVEGGADNVNQCFLEASRFGSTGLVRILLQIAQRNSLNIEVERALGVASRYGMISTMECLVEEGNATTFLCPLMRASERGCLLVVEWFAKRGCRDMELCLALTAAIASNQIEIAAFILPHIPTNVLVDLRIEILKVAGERCGGSLDGVSFLLKSNFLGDPAATYAVADSTSRSDEEPIIPQLKKFLLEHWSEKAFLDGLRQGQEHYLNMTRILKCGESPISLGDLPAPLRVAIAYLPLYRECVEAGGCLLSQRLRGRLVEAARRLGGKTLDKAGQGRELLAVLEHHLPHFLLYEPSVA